jgi:fumarate reductase subunit C
MARPYPRQHASKTWYLKQPRYRIFILREWSAVPIAIYFTLLVFLAARSRDGAASLADYVETALTSPLSYLFHAIVLAAALLHTVTWFRAVPKAIRLRQGDELVPPSMLVGAHYGGWIAISALVLACFVIGS